MKNGTVAVSRMRRAAGLAAMVCGAVLVGMLGGCNDEKLVTIKNEAEFKQLVLDSRQPVIVEFSKDNCPTCDILEPELVKVSKEYEGRAKFYKFMLLNGVFQHYCPAISEAFKLQLVPTAVLFVDGQEKQRWFMDYSGDTYRNALNPLVAQAQLRQQ
jgi:thioredoxin 1